MFTLLLLFSVTLLSHHAPTEIASANFTYHRPSVTVVSPVTDVIYDYGSEIPLAVKVEMHPSGFPNLAPEELSEVRYSVDGLPEVNASVRNEVNSKGYCMWGYANEIITGLSRGAHKLFIRGHTSYGNFSSQAISFNRTVYFIVGTVSPAIELFSPQPTTYNSITVSVKFLSYKSLVWAGYSLDQKMVVDCMNGANITYLQNGAHSLRVYGTASGGNVYASQSVVFSINGKNPPVITLDIEKMIYDRQFLPSDYQNMTYWHLVFDVNEPTSWTGCNLNGGANQTIERNPTLHLAYGTYTIIVYAADLCGNKGASAPYTFTVGPGEAGSAYKSSSSNSTTISLPDSNEDSTSNQPFFMPTAVAAGVALITASAVLFFLRKNQKRVLADSAQ